MAKYLIVLGAFIYSVGNLCSKLLYIADMSQTALMAIRGSVTYCLLVIWTLMFDSTRITSVGLPLDTLLMTRSTFGFCQIMLLNYSFANGVALGNAFVIKEGSSSLFTLLVSRFVYSDANGMLEMACSVSYSLAYC